MNQEAQDWTKDAFVAELARRSGQPAVAVFERFYGWTLARPYVYWHGSGDREDGHATFWPSVLDQVPPFGFRVDGEVTVPLRQLSGVPGATKAWRRELLERLADAVGDERLRGVGLATRPTFAIERLAEDAALLRAGALLDAHVRQILDAAGDDDDDDDDDAEATLLYTQSGATDVTILAKVDAEGTLQIHGSDFGEAPEQAFGRDEYEYWLTLQPAQARRLLLDLLLHKHGGDAYVVSRLQTRLEALGIASEFFSI